MLFYDLLLLNYWNSGKEWCTEQDKSVVYKISLICKSSDIPATCKCGEFRSHNAKKYLFPKIIRVL